MVVSLIAAVVSALCYGVASVMQAIAARAASRLPARPGAGARVDPGLLVRMLRQWRFVASLGLDMLGFVGQLVALHRLPLFVVQAMVAANLAVTAVFATWLIGALLRWREWLAVGGVVAGVGMLGSSAGPEGATSAGLVFKLSLIIAMAGLALAGMAAGRLPSPFRTPVLGVVAGIGYGVVGVAARVLTGFAPAALVRDPAAYAVAAAGIVSFLFYASALEGGSVTVATAPVVLAETLPPAAIGVLFLGDRTRPGLQGVAAAGFVLAVACAVALARFGEAGHDAGETPAGPAGSNAAVASRRLLSWWPVDLAESPPYRQPREPRWPDHRTAQGWFRHAICSSPEVSPPAWARGSPPPAWAGSSSSAGCGSPCRSSIRT